MTLNIEPGDNPGVKRLKMTFDMFIRTVAFKQFDKYADCGLVMHYQLFCICEAMNTYESFKTDQALLDLISEIESASRMLGEMDRDR